MTEKDARRPYDEGLRHLAAGAFGKAARAFADALREDPEHFDAAWKLGQCYERLGRWTLAVDALRHACALDPLHVDPLIGVAESLRQAGCYHDALSAYDEALELRRDHLFAIAGKAETLRMLGRPEDAIEWFDHALQLLPEHVFALRGKAAALNALARYAEALPYWEDALKAEPRSGFAVAGRDEAERALRTRDLVPLTEPPAPATPLGADQLAAQQAHAWGRALVADRRFDAAAGAFNEALMYAPEWVECLCDLAMALEDCTAYDDALAVYERVMALDPTRVSAASNIGETLRKAERFEDAVVAYDRALELDPGYVYALAGRADALRMLGRFDDALEGYDRALARKPTHAFALRGRAAVLNALHRFAEALPLWQRALDLDPGAEFARAGLRHCQAELGRRAREPEVAAPAGSQDDDRVRREARAAYDRGRALVQSGHLREAIEAFREAADADPRWSEPWFLAGQAYDDDQQHGEAARAWQEALARDPEHLDAALGRADALRKNNDLADAISAYDAVIARQGEIARALAGRAESMRLLGRFEESLPWFDRALDANPDHFFSLCGRAAALNALRRFDDALPSWRRALELEPQSPFAQRGLAHCETELGDVTEPPALPSVTVSSGLPAARRDRAAARDALDRGRSFHKDRDYASAVRCYQKSLKLDPTFSEAALRLGMAYEDDRQFRRAIEAYERCLQLDPAHHQAATNIGEAYRKNEQYEEAVAAYDRALDVRSDYLYALAGRGEAMRMLGQHEASLAWFDKALTVNDKHAFAIQGKAAALNSCGRFKEALPLWKRALSLDPQSQFALDGKSHCEAQLRQSEQEDDTEEESATPTLDEQGRDLTALAREGRLGHIVGRKQEIRSVLKTLVRRQKANPLLLGEPGVGKTAVVEGVARLLVSDEAPARLRDVRIIELSMGSLVAGTKYRGTFEERLKSIIKEAKASPGLVLFIDEIHTLVGAGRTEGGSLDAANILKPALARGEITVIGATTHAEYRKHFESDSALERRFQPITINEPTPEATVELLAQVQHLYAEHHKVRIDPEALHACVTMAVRFISDRRLPDKALDVLDEACAEASLAGGEVVTPSVVAQVVAERSGVPVQKLDAVERARMADIERFVHTRVVSQDLAVQIVANSVRLSRTGLRAATRPRGVFLFVGPSGVGKTELARALADFLFLEGNALIKLDMSEYSERFSGSRLIGAPPGYSGHGDEGQLTGALRTRPYSVVLLDEFEKAHPDVQAMFLGLFDEGVITDSEGRKVEAKEAFFILTTNCGSDVSTRSRVGFGSSAAEDPREVALERVRPYFRPEMLNRLDEIVLFAPLDEADLREVVRLHLERLRERAADVDVDLSWTPAVLELCAAWRPDPKFGARPAIRAIDELVAQPLSRLLLLAAEHEGTRAVRAAVRDGRVVFVEGEAPAHPQRSQAGATANDPPDPEEVA